MMVAKGGVTAPLGFLANGVKAGIKKSGKLDLALLYSEVPAIAAAAFTTNRFQASSIKISKLHLRGRTHQAIIVNSGNANCANGKTGDRDASLTADHVADNLSLGRREVLVASTGIIGKKLPVEKIQRSIPLLVSGLSHGGAAAFAEAIMTTDTVRKEFVIKVKLGAATVAIGGACKGVGMIYPNMITEKHATMLAFITTDAAISKRMLEASIAEAVEDSFNMVSVDGDMSTNDSCFILANGLAGNRRINAKDKDYDIFTGALKFLAKELAKMLARDGEGATKFVEIDVVNAASAEDAKAMARKISASSLLKACIFGEDPNWGRIVAACGASGVGFDPQKTDIYLGDIKALANGASVKNFDRGKAQKIFKEKTIRIKVDLKSGRDKATAWTCDFSKEYVAINSEYST